ncbi:MAG: multidrug effflux MFS transporter [Desulfobacteraceae bacterium]|jgi:DHA1 family bicyclomycin/chloramphenicol resistance-like MFS transporter
MKRWIGLLALLAAFPPLSTDMYLPAIPTLVKEWEQPLWVVNLTLVCFFITYSLFLLVYGPVSDRFGRRPLLKIGIPIYVVASLLCALAPNAESLIAFRIVQAAGGACASSLALAICRDVFEARDRERVLAYMGVVIALSPMMAPVIGGWTLVFFSWNWIFVILAGLGCVAFLGVHRMQETLHPVKKTTRVALVTNYTKLLRNRSYLGMVFLVSFSVIPFFSFIGASSDIYITRFGLSEQIYGYFFGFNALALMVGALLFARMNRVLSSRTVLSIGFFMIAAGGVWLMFSPGEGPWDLALPMAIISFSSGMSRPPSNNLVLEQVDRGAGAASSLLMFFLMTCGGLGMGFISLAWPDKIHVLGIMGMICGSITFVFWMVFQRAVRIP